MPDTFPTIIADPPWLYGNFSNKAHGAAKGHYNSETVETICKVPVAKWARKDSILFLWATLPKLDQAIDVMRAWGFSLVTSVPWTKTVPAAGDIKRGIGFWFYSTSEILLVCRKGKAKAPKQTGADKQMGLLTGEPPTFYAKLGPHSRKPLSLIEWIEAYFPGPYLELYARTTRPGWTCWGLETGYFLNQTGVHKYEDLDTEPNVLTDGV